MVWRAAITAIGLILACGGAARAQTANAVDKADAYVCRDIADPFAAEAVNSRQVAAEMKMMDYAAIRQKLLDTDRAAEIGHVDDLKNAAIKALQAYGEALDDAAYSMRKCARAVQ